MALIATGISFSANAELPVQCSVRYATKFVDHLDGLPAQIQEDVGRGGKIASAGQPFQAYDNVTDPNLPNRRFVLAGQTGAKWFVWLEHGGFVRHYDVYGYSQLWEKADRFSWYRSAELQGDPCIAINAFLDGVTTPTDGRH